MPKQIPIETVVERKLRTLLERCDAYDLPDEQKDTMKVQMDAVRIGIAWVKLKKGKDEPEGSALDALNWNGDERGSDDAA